MLSTRKGCKATQHQRLERNINPFMAFVRSWFCSETPSTKKSGVVNSKDSTSPPHSKTTWLNTKSSFAPNFLFIFLMKATRIWPCRAAFIDENAITCFIQIFFKVFHWKFWLTSFFKCILLALTDSPVCPLCTPYFAQRYQILFPRYFSDRNKFQQVILLGQFVQNSEKCLKVAFVQHRPSGCSEKPKY